MIEARASLLAKASNLNPVEFIELMLAERKATKAMDTGTIVHSLILEKKLPDSIVVLDYEDYRTKAAQTDKKAAYDCGKIPCLRKEVQEFLDDDFSQVQKLFAGYDVEVAKSMLYRKDFAKITGHLDAFNGHHVKDLKVTNSKTFSNVEKEIFYKGYDIQVFLYMLMTKTRTASIVFFNLDTGMYQEVDMHLENIKDSCIDRLDNKSFRNIMAYEEYQQGLRRLPNAFYSPFSI